MAYKLPILLLICQLVVPNLAFFNMSEFTGPFCARNNTCCADREDACSYPLADTRCYCDAFCVGGRPEHEHEDCCPDYRRTCKGSNKGSSDTCENEVYGDLHECDRIRYTIDNNVITKVNDDGSLGWKASDYSQFAGRTLNDTLKYKLGTIIDPLLYSKNATYPKTDVPLHVTYEYDSRRRWPEYISPVADQGWCGSDWAVSVATVVSDGLSIQSNSAKKLSAQILLSCNSGNDCEGGYLHRAWIFTRSSGLVDEKCFSYTGSKAKTCPIHNKSYWDGGCKLRERQKRYKYDTLHRLVTENGVKSYIFYCGSVQAVMTVYQDFFHYRSGIYRHSLYGDQYKKGNHSVRILGWGEEKGQKYWIVANSWGTGWGEGGYFRIARGRNESNIESLILSPICKPYYSRIQSMIDNEVITKVNKNATLGWHASDYSQFANKTLNDGLIYKLGTSINPSYAVRTVPYDRKVVYEPTFDSRKRYSENISPIADQGWCGSDWAVSLASVVSDSYAIQSEENVRLSAQFLLSCLSGSNCEGGDIYESWDFTYDIGLVEEQCFSYKADMTICPYKYKGKWDRDGCNITTLTRYKIDKPIRLENESDIMHDISTVGSVQAVMTVYQDFFHYRSGIYHHSKYGDQYKKGNHSVRILGWGEEKNQKYWIVANSWGTEWGENGYFRIARGINEANIESLVLSAPRVKKVTIPPPEVGNIHIIDNNVITKVNDDTSLSWHASDYSQFANKTLHDALIYKLGTSINPSYAVSTVTYDRKVVYEPTFDSRKRYSENISPIADQGWCGSDWAVSLASVVSDSYAIQSEENVRLSAQFLLSCLIWSDCKGGDIYKSWDFTNYYGLVEEQCFSYKANSTIICPYENEGKWDRDGCHITTQTKYIVDKPVRLENESDIMHDISTVGSVQAVMTVYQDFFHYRSGIYRHSKYGDQYKKGNHSVRILGWGEEKNQKYWIVANSWGTEWGENGYFRIARGNNEANIESLVLSAPRVKKVT